jgi:hypothetical protein
MLHFAVRAAGRRAGLWLASAGLVMAGATAASPPLHPVVEAEEEVYSYKPANNGAGPLWCSGSTCLVHLGDDPLASGLESIQDCPPLNNCRWTLFRRRPTGWELQQADPHDRTREPSPLAGFAPDQIFLSVNPTLRTNLDPGGGPARPQLLAFSATDARESFRRLLPVWKDAAAFTEHSYRSLAADGSNRELILFQNVGYTHAEWSFFDRQGQWSAQGQLKWPWGAEYDRPEPIRVCYPTVALKDKAVYFCGVSDVLEPYQAWRAYKKQLTGQEWDYDFRRLFYTWTEDITKSEFHDWVEIASRDKTCGWISPCDLWVAPNGAVHLLWTERAIDERLRKKFFPDASQSHALNYAVVQDGKVQLRRSLVESGEGGEIPSAGRFQVTPENRLIVFYYVQGKSPSGDAVAENRLLEIESNGNTSRPIRVPLQAPFTAAFTATVRAGSPPSRTLELLGQQTGKPNTISYAKVRLW